MIQSNTNSARKNKLIMVIVAILFLLLALAAGFFFYKWLQIKKDPDSASQEASKGIVAEVGEIYQLPTGEEPTVAKIQDKNKLVDQKFFDAAQNGDYLLIYSQNKTALIYRQEIKKLINVGPIALDSNQVKSSEVKITE